MNVGWSHQQLNTTSLFHTKTHKLRENLCPTSCFTHRFNLSQIVLFYHSLLGTNWNLIIPVIWIYSYIIYTFYFKFNIYTCIYITHTCIYMKVENFTAQTHSCIASYSDSGRVNIGLKLSLCSWEISSTTLYVLMGAWTPEAILRAPGISSTSIWSSK